MSKEDKMSDTINSTRSWGTHQEYKHLLDVMSGFVGVVDEDGRLRFASEGPLTSFGYSEEEILGKPFWEAAWFDFSKESQDVVKDAVSKALGEKTTQCEVEIATRDGTPISLVFNIAPLSATDGKGGAFLGIAAMTKPIVEQHRFEKIRAAEIKFRSMFEIIEEVYFRVAKGGELSLVTPSGVSLLDYDSADDLIGKNTKELWSSSEERSKFLGILMQTGRVDGYEALFKKRDGSLVAVQLDSHLLFDANGEVIGSEGIFRDITERSEYQERLKRSYEDSEKERAKLRKRLRREGRRIRELEKHYNTLAERASEGVAICQDGTFKFVNAKLAQMAGYDVEELVDKEIEVFLSPESAQLLRTWCEQSMGEGEIPGTSTIEILRRDGGVQLTEAEVASVRHNGKSAEMVILRNIA